jgi:exopolyphosphatase/guanosine-5'-triphosphate,3'-diphosphate pyrophosphatase
MLTMDRRQETLAEPFFSEQAVSAFNKSGDKKPGHLLVATRLKSVQLLADNFLFEKKHSEHVANLSVRLFDETVSLHSLQPKYRELLWFSALLHDIGLFLSYSLHHRHTFYLIKNAELFGFTENEKNIMANVARYHRKSHPKLKHGGFAGLSYEDREIVVKLAALLRIADGLDRSHTGNVEDLSVSTKAGQSDCQLIARHKNAMDLEIWGANRKKLLFEETFGVEVSFNSSND